MFCALARGNDCLRIAPSLRLGLGSRRFLQQDDVVAWYNGFGGVQTGDHNLAIVDLTSKLFPAHVGVPRISRSRHAPKRHNAPRTCSVTMVGVTGVSGLDIKLGQESGVHLPIVLVVDLPAKGDHVIGLHIGRNLPRDCLRQWDEDETMALK